MDQLTRSDTWTERYHSSHPVHHYAVHDSSELAAVHVSDRCAECLGELGME